MTCSNHKGERNGNRKKTQLTHFPFCDPIFEPADSVGHQYKMVTSYVECERLQFMFRAGLIKAANQENSTSSGGL
jgi:hypothetical protein